MLQKVYKESGKEVMPAFVHLYIYVYVYIGGMSLFTPWCYMLSITL